MTKWFLINCRPASDTLLKTRKESHSINWVFSGTGAYFLLESHTNIFPAFPLISKAMLVWEILDLSWKYLIPHSRHCSYPQLWYCIHFNLLHDFIYPGSGPAFSFFLNWFYSFYFFWWAWQLVLVYLDPAKRLY